MRKLILKLYDRLIVGILFSFFLVSSCKPDEPVPVPAYGVVPMYGVVPVSSISIQEVPQTKLHVLK
jgi:xanthosine utilization system XapX-like protein